MVQRWLEDASTPTSKVLCLGARSIRDGGTGNEGDSSYVMQRFVNFTSDHTNFKME